MSYYLAALRKYGIFAGRARRKEYWVFLIVTVIIGFIADWIDHRLGIAGRYIYGLYGPVYFFYIIAVFLPTFAVTVRRLHDLNKSGYWALIYLIPVMGWIWLFIMLSFRGTKGANRFGPDPLVIAEKRAEPDMPGTGENTPEPDVLDIGENSIEADNFGDEK